MIDLLAVLVRVARRWSGRPWIVLLVQLDDDVRALTAPGDLPVSVRSNTDGSVGVTVGCGDDGEAWLADLRALMSTGTEHPVALETRICRPE